MTQTREEFEQPPPWTIEPCDCGGVNCQGWRVVTAAATCPTCGQKGRGMMDHDVVLACAEQFRLTNTAFLAAGEAKRRAEAALQDAETAEALALNAVQAARRALLNAASGKPEVRV